MRTAKPAAAESVPGNRCFSCHLSRNGMALFRVWDGPAGAYVPRWLCPACHERRQRELVARLKARA